MFLGPDTFPLAKDQRIQITGYVFLGPDTFPLAEDQPDIIIIIIISSIISIIISIIIHINIIIVIIIIIIIIIIIMIPPRETYRAQGTRIRGPRNTYPDPRIRVPWARYVSLG